MLGLPDHQALPPGQSQHLWWLKAWYFLIEETLGGKKKDPGGLRWWSSG